MIGTLLNERFRLEEKIGSGGMSTVYRAWDPTLERWVAIKLMHRDISEEPDQLERFRREARAVARLSHPHVVTVIDFGEDEGTPYIVLEYVEGETLKDRIKRMGRLPVAEAVAYGIEIGRALTCAHTAHLVHRDVKPQNVLIDMEGRAKVTDFGIARSLEVDVAGLTADGRVLGTTDYVSPEQAMGKEVTEQSDVYSLGIVMFEMLTGEVPYTGREPGRGGHEARQGADPRRAAHPARGLGHAGVGGRARHGEGAGQPLRDRRGDDRGPRGGAGHRGRARGRGRIGGHDGPARAGQRHQGLRPGAPAQPAPVAAVGAGRADPGRRRRGLLRLAHREGRRAGVDRTARGPDRRVAGLERRERLRPGGRRARVPESPQNVLDRNPSTQWDTERYDGGFEGVGKSGVGLFVDAGRPVEARALKVTTSTPGFTAAVYASDDVPDDIGGWTRVSKPARVGEEQTIRFDSPGRYRRYLLWITKLPEGNKAALQEVNLYR